MLDRKKECMQALSIDWEEMRMKDVKKFLWNKIADIGIIREFKSWKDGWLGSVCGEYIFDMKGERIMVGDKLWMWLWKLKGGISHCQWSKKEISK